MKATSFSFRQRPAAAQDSVAIGALRPFGRVVRLLPGLGLCSVVTAAAFTVEAAERQLFGRAWLEALVLAILIGTAVRSSWRPAARWQPGIDFCAKTLLEVAVMLLGAAISFHTLGAVGPGLLFGIAGVVALVIPASYLVGRLLGLPRRLAILVACGNSICGNSAIAAVAPVIGADCDDIAASIAFTAVLGVLVVLGLPLAVPLLHLSQNQFGVLSGLTVYAVPQVIAAAAPVGLVATQVGTLVKLVRVLTLGPVVLVLALLAGRAATPAKTASGGRAVHRVAPWFIIGFLVLATLHSLDLLPAAALAPSGSLATVLTILAMAALGLGVDVRMVARAGIGVTLAVTLSLLMLGAVSLGLIHALGVV